MGSMAISGSTGSSGPTGGSNFSSSSLNALQAISEGVLPSSLSSPSHKLDSSPSINSTQPGPPSQSGAAKVASMGETKSPSGTAPSAGPDQQHTAQSETAADKPDSQCGKEGQVGPDGTRREGHKKLLQLLTSPSGELNLGSDNGGPPSGRPSTPDSKEPGGCMTSPSSTGVSSSSSGPSGGAGGGQLQGPGCVSSSAGSLQEKHKILHKLLQNGNTPDELARITVEATGKVSVGGEHPGQEGGAVEIKQEPHSPKRPNVLLQYLLKDDAKDEVKPTLDSLEAHRVGQGGGVTTSDPSNHEMKIKLDPADEVRPKSASLTIQRFETPGILGLKFCLAST